MRKFHLCIPIRSFGSCNARSPSRHQAPLSKAPLIIAMKDPGCHWFYVGRRPEQPHATSSRSPAAVR